MKKRGLGRDLSALLGNRPSRASEPEAEVAALGLPDGDTTPDSASDNNLADGVRMLAVENMQRGRYQPRQDFSEGSLIELANSIKENGIVQPILVRALSTSGQFEIVAGERRWRAAQLAQLKEVPVIVKDLSDQETIAVALIENIQRENLNPIEEAVAIHRLIEEFDLTHQQAADSIGRSRTAISNLLRLLGLDNNVKDALSRGDLEMGHARALLGLDMTLQSDAAEHVISKGMSVRETEAYVSKLKGPKTPKYKEKSQTTTDPHIQSLENQLAEKLGAKVHCQHGKGGKGKLLISYNSLDELDGILDHIK